MRQARERRLRDGTRIEVHRNSGLRKICSCPRRGWSKCPHPWHFSFCWRGTQHRFSLARYAAKEITGKTDAETLADTIRAGIRAGTFRLSSDPRTASQRDATGETTFEAFARIFLERYSKERGEASWQDDGYMIEQLVAFPIVDGLQLGQKSVWSVTEDDLEAFIKHLTTLGRASSTRNHYVQLIRAMSRWAVRKGYRNTPMLGDDSDVIRRRKEAVLFRSYGPFTAALTSSLIATVSARRRCWCMMARPFRPVFASAV